MVLKAFLATGVVLLLTGAFLPAGAGQQATDGFAAASRWPATTGDTARVELAISGMTCGSCATTARIALERVSGVYDAEVSYDSASAVVLYDPEETSPEEFIAYMRKMTGYEARVVEPAKKPKGKP